MFRTTLSFVLLASIGSSAFCQSNPWRPSALPLTAFSDPAFFQINAFASFHADPRALESELSKAPSEDALLPGGIIFLPNPKGSLERFQILVSPIQSPAVAKQSRVRTYSATGLDDPFATGRLDIGPNGFHGMILSVGGDYFIDPANLGNLDDYIVFYKSSCVRRLCFKCDMVAPKDALRRAANPYSLQAPGSDRKEYRLALKGTGEYTAFYGGVLQADGGSVTVMNRVNGVYEKDIAIRMIIVNLVNYPDAATDPYTNESGSTMLGQNQTVCDAVPGTANYDIGHVFSTGGGGIAGLRVVGVLGQKARGVTGLPSPLGDPFAIDYVSHEMGHQYGANHTFNGTTGSCGGGNRSASHAYEPGSGTTIMAYAGICGAENVQNFSDDYFHTDSQSAIASWRNNVGSAGTSVPTGNTSPTVNAGPDFTIPQDTSFRLVATGADADGDSLTYCWEQFNLGTATPSADESTRPLFRTLKPVASSTRWFPKPATVLANVFDQWENLPSVNRTMTFRCTVRDNRANGGNYEWDAATVTVSGAPFAVTSPNTAVTWRGNTTQTVTWTVGGGNVAANVRILLSTDGGNSYYNGGTTTLLESTPNDGSQDVAVPNIDTSQARIIVEPVGNVFYDISNVNFAIASTTTAIVNPATYSVLVGSETSHDLSALFLSDDIRQTIQADPNQGFTSTIELAATAPSQTPVRLSFLLESSTNFEQRRRMVQFFDYAATQWVTLGTSEIPLADGTVQVDVIDNPARFIAPGTKEIRARIACDFPTASRTLSRSFEFIDRSVWEIQY